MRSLTLASTLVLAASAALVACATPREAYVRSPDAEKELARWLDGRVAGKPQTCLPSFRSQDMIVIDERTILFRDGANRVWRNDVNGPCSGLGRPGYALLTKQFGTGLCRGEIAQVVDTLNGFTVGTCSLGDFVPYTGPMRR
ncbi:hypothetical protein [Sphingomonas astaxanthinifaciens]|uniref:Lipoprotein n=1 Tax=Sphingomonas astaxanthinifaciens DSM 22298 TaxID=1123267 RepID=A0ABQ5Z5A2_9SPHN|nr:hypothetical protein [Sphingomonas astaxanthinifaciens]GLR46561.1 hypothetical protein GCM10007925_02720 [Sphingomonas astaxanthinifaciens DSM 22298]